jgi:peptidoglycan/xylan/chitin deacetylase (PgdA/CDA1 family)
VVNITVHGIGPPCRRLDPGEDETWVTIGQFEHVLDALEGRSDVRLTFDDGNVSDVEIALPRLLERGLTAEFFVLAGRLEEHGRLDKGDIRSLADAGMAIGSHGWFHQDWRKVDDLQARQEIDHSRRVLGDIVGAPVTSVAIPFGSYDRHVLRRLQAARVARVYTSDGGRARPDAWLQARTSLRHDLDAAWLTDVLDRPTPFVQQARCRAVRAVKRLRG